MGKDGYYTREYGTFLSVAEGKLRNKNEGLSIDGFVGRITKIDWYEDQYEGKPANKYRVFMTADESGKRVIITFGDETYFALGFFSRLAELPKPEAPFLLGVLQSKNNPKVSNCFLKQDDKVIKVPEGFPQPEKVVIGKTTVMDWTKVTERFNQIIAHVNALVGQTDTTHADPGGGDAAAPPPDEPPF